MHKFRKLKIWDKAMDFVTRVYDVTADYPKNELYGLVDQVRRAAVSVALNIAEGTGAGGDKEFSRFLQFSLRSIYEVITGLEIGIRLGYGNRQKTRH